MLEELKGLYQDIKKEIIKDFNNSSPGLQIANILMGILVVGFISVVLFFLIIKVPIVFIVLIAIGYGLLRLYYFLDKRKKKIDETIQIERKAEFEKMKREADEDAKEWKRRHTAMKEKGHTTDVNIKREHFSTSIGGSF